MKSALVLGGSSDIGASISKLLLARGWHVFAQGNRWAGRAAQQLFEQPRLKKFSVDLSKREEVNHVLQDSPGFLRVDSVINCVGCWTEGSFEDHPINELEESFRINVFHPYLFIRSCIPGMLERNWGRVVQLSSIGVKFGGAVNTFPYSWSKHTLEFIPAEFKQWARSNVFYNCVRVGVVDTRIHSSNQKKDMSARIGQIPIGRMIDKDEISRAIIWLASEDNEITTGQVISFSGGE